MDTQRIIGPVMATNSTGLFDPPLPGPLPMGEGAQNRRMPVHQVEG